MIMKRVFGTQKPLRQALLITVAFLSLSTSALSTKLTAHTQGVFGPLHNWPIIPVAMMLMPDGRVFSYGTNTVGSQGAKMHYVIWDPGLGTVSSAFTVLPNTTNTDIFCSGHAIIPENGQALVVGGDYLINGTRNYGNSDVNIFDPQTNSLTRQSQQMAYKRWYTTSVTLSNGEHVILGGRDSRDFAGTYTKPSTAVTYSPIPEIRAVDGVWRALTDAKSDYAYGANNASWYYPQAWVAPQGHVFILGHNNSAYKLDINGKGSITKYARTLPPVGRTSLASVMHAPGKILSLRKYGNSVVVDLNVTGDPTVTPAGMLSTERQLGNLTVLADGRAWANGGSPSGNSLTNAALTSELWDPATKEWQIAASASTQRLYHSTSILLPDATVMTGGGGAPGPLKQLNGEIYYPPYLFKKDGSGEFAPRPTIIDAPSSSLSWDQEFSIEGNEAIHRVTLLRLGAVTHNIDVEARFFELPLILPASNIVSVKTPVNANLAPPGFYQVFIWNSEGVPSVAKILQIH